MKKTIKRSLDLTITLEPEQVNVDIFEPESGEVYGVVAPLSFDEHPEFDKTLGDELYSLFELWRGDDDETDEDDEMDGTDEPSVADPVQAAYDILNACINGDGEVGEAEAIETALGFLGEALA